MNALDSFKGSLRGIRPPKQPAEFWRAKSLVQQHDGHCEYCGEPVDYEGEGWLGSRRSATVDHLVPTSHGGAPLDSNLALACEHCNGTGIAIELGGSG